MTKVISNVHEIRTEDKFNVIDTKFSSIKYTNGRKREKPWDIQKIGSLNNPFSFIFGYLFLNV